MVWSLKDNGLSAELLTAVDAGPLAADVMGPRQTRDQHSVHHRSESESRSLTDARAVIDVAAFTRVRHARRTAVGVPLAMLGSDLLALLLESVIVRRGTYDAVLFAALVLLARATVRQYRPRLHLSSLDDVPRSVASVFAAVGLVTVTLAGGGVSTVAGELLRRAGWFLLLSFVLQGITMGLLRRARRHGSSGRRTLVVGAGRVGTRIGEALLSHPELGLRPVGFVDPDALTAHEDLPLPLLSTDLANLASTITRHQIDTTVLAFSGTREAQVVDAVIMANQTGSALMVVPRMFELHHDGLDVERVRGIPLLRLYPDPTLRPSWWIKRSVDVGIALVSLLLLALPLALIAALVLIGDGRPVLFWQERIGLDGKTFRLCKFRSLPLRPESESQTTWSVARDPQVGRVGKVLRRTSFDELPQLWNILRGQMSVVGPRPERPTFARKFASEHERYWARHRVPVGLTGLAQVSGLRGDTSIRERARYDNYYIVNWSLWLDAKIVLLTVREVFGGKGR